MDEEFISKKTFIKFLLAVLAFFVIAAVVTDFPLYRKISTESDARLDIAMIGSGENIQRVFGEFSNVFDGFAQKKQAMVVYHVYKTSYSEKEINDAVSMISHDNIDLIISGQSIVPKIKKHFPNTPAIVPFSTDVVENKLIDNDLKHNGHVVYLDSQHGVHSVKRLELLIELVPTAKKILVMRGDPTIYGENIKIIEDLKSKAEEYGVQIIDKTFKTRLELQLFLNSYDFNEIDAIYRYPGSFAGSNIDLVFNANKRYRKPIMVLNDRELADGGLIAYGPTMFELGARVAGITNQILFEGQKPESIPVVYPNSIKLGINTRFAKSLNIEIPEKILDEMDYTIE